MLTDVMPREGSPALIPPFDNRYERGIAYQGVLVRMQFCLQRRIDLASGVFEYTVKIFLAWVAVATAWKSVPLQYVQVISILEAVFLWLPVFGMLKCLLYMGIGRSVYSDEIDYIESGIEYEISYTTGYGVASRRAREIIEASYWRPATTEIAGVACFSLWLVLALISRYFTL